MNWNRIIVFDLETDLPTPEDANPVQIGAIVLHPRSLEVVEGGEFNAMIRPPGIDTKEYYTDAREGTISFHTKVQNKTREEIIDSWKAARPEKDVMADFATFCKRFNYGKKRGMYSRVIASGYNVIKFDIPILQRVCEKHGHVDKKGTQNLFFPRDILDVMHIAWNWFENLDNGPPNLKLDTLREYFGMSGENAHDALQDVKDTAEILRRFMRTTRKVSQNVQFEGAMSATV